MLPSSEPDAFDAPSSCAKERDSFAPPWTSSGFSDVIDSSPVYGSESLVLADASKKDFQNCVPHASQLPSRLLRRSLKRTLTDSQICRLFSP